MPEDLDWILRESRLREETLAFAFRQFSAAWPLTDKADCFLNRALLLMACESYFRDVLRRKDFHDIGTADDHKCAGYTAKWLMRFRPIQYCSNHISDRIAFANELFSLWIACGHLGVRMSHIPPSVVDHIVYHLRFRPFDADAWSLSFFLLQSCAQGGFLQQLAADLTRNRD